MQVWLHLNGIQQGPYTLEQLKLLPIESSTPVWYDGLPRWMPAGEAPATAFLFATASTAPAGEPAPAAAEAGPAAASPASGIEMRPPKPRTFIVWNIILTVLCLCPTALAGVITGILSSARYAAGNYAASKRLSEASEWLLIISIVWVIVSIPVSIALSAM